MPRECTPTEAALLFSFAADRYERDFQQLCALDSVAGDGDLGLTLGTGFRAATEALKSSTEADLSGALHQAALALNRTAPSTLGTLLTGAIMAAAQVAGDASEGSPKQQARMLKAAFAAIARRGKASPGDKTILDALGPASDAFSESADAGSTLLAAVTAASQAAKLGADATKQMVPRAGRARWLAERSIGHADAGAIAAVWFFEAWEVSLRG